jgi:hypothetical protein
MSTRARAGKARRGETMVGCKCGSPDFNIFQTINLLATDEQRKVIFLLRCAKCGRSPLEEMRTHGCDA